MADQDDPKNPQGNQNPQGGDNNGTPPAGGDNPKGNEDPQGGEGSGEEDEEELEKIEFEDDGAEPPKPPKREQPKDDPDDDTDPEDRAAIQREARRIVDTEVAPIREQAENARIDNEWRNLVEDYPELKPYEGKVKRWAKGETYRMRPVRDALLDIAGLDIFTKIGAIRRKKADKEAAEDRGGGSSSRSSVQEGESLLNSKIPSFKGKTQKEINAIMADYHRGKYN